MDPHFRDLIGRRKVCQSPQMNGFSGPTSGALTKPKVIPARAISGQQGINLIERILLRMGLAWHPRNAGLDAGIDGNIEVRDRDTQRATNCILQVQSKVLSGQFTAETESTFEYLCDERDIEYWLGGNVPVILVVSRPNNDEAYWVSVRDAFATIDARRNRRVFFDKQRDRFDESSRVGLIASRSLRQVDSISRRRRRRKGCTRIFCQFGNLVPNFTLARQIFGAAKRSGACQGK